MTRNDEDVGKHLRLDEIDLCIGSDDAWGRSVWLHDHLRECERCVGEIAFLRSLDHRLANLLPPRPSPGFSSLVMARVGLPVPWYTKAWETVRARWIVFAAVATASLAAVGGVSYWLFGVQGVTPGGLVGFVFNGVETLVLKAVIAGGRLLYSLGLVDAGSSLLDGGGPTQALSALALLGTLSLMSLMAVSRLMQERAPQASRVMRT